MKTLNLNKMEKIEGGYNVLATFGCGVGVGFMIFQPYSVFALGEATAALCVVALAEM